MIGMRAFWLTLKDRRLRAVMKARKAAGPARGDLAAEPGRAGELLGPTQEALRLAAVAGGPEASAAARAAAADFAALLEKAFSDMALHGVKPDAAMTEALGCAQRACTLAPRLLSPSGRTWGAASARALCAAGRKALSQASAAARSDVAGFPANLKFCSIYSGLDGALDALQRCCEALFGI